MKVGKNIIYNGYRYIRITDFTKEGLLDEHNKLSLPIEIGVEYELADGEIK
ncbi:MAG: hypothetical protein IPL13_14350 [Saprospiraceae bacterium]|nr:hypothetical protein [Candidatus Brachybacter algidus]